jgi:hypothetical protein
MLSAIYVLEVPELIARFSTMRGTELLLPNF